MKSTSTRVLNGWSPAASGASAIGGAQQRHMPVSPELPIWRQDADARAGLDMAPQETQLLANVSVGAHRIFSYQQGPGLGCFGRFSPTACSARVYSAFIDMLQSHLAIAGGVTDDHVWLCNVCGYSAGAPSIYARVPILNFVAKDLLHLAAVGVLAAPQAIWCRRRPRTVLSALRDSCVQAFARHAGLPSPNTRGSIYFTPALAGSAWHHDHPISASIRVGC